jgi:hypothetical protein
MPTQTVDVAPPQARAMLEPNEQPLWSSVALDAAALPREVLFFGYGIGDQVAGAGTGAVAPATPWHTNMLSPRQLASPKTFEISAFSVYVHELAPPQAAAAAALHDPSTAAAFENSDALDDLKQIWFSGTFLFTIAGLKPYLEIPLFMVPANVGICGFSAIEAAEAASNFMRSETIHTTGEPYNLGPNRIFVPSQQEIDARIQWLQTNRANLVDTNMLTVYLEGRQGREVL